MCPGRFYQYMYRAAAAAIQTSRFHVYTCTGILFLKKGSPIISIRPDRYAAVPTGGYVSKPVLWATSFHVPVGLGALSEPHS
eukprot:SAG31_NODE_2881_length_4958_cov_3.159086_1_plen_82_part_00